MTKHGGRLTDHKSEADFIILDHRSPSFAATYDRYSRRYPDSSLVSFVWVDDCAKREYRFNPGLYPPRRPTATAFSRSQIPTFTAVEPSEPSFESPLPTPALPAYRYEFTEGDKNDLAAWILNDRRQCEKDNRTQSLGGRVLYRQMENWFPRHTGESWRSYYKRNVGPLPAIHF